MSQSRRRAFIRRSVTLAGHALVLMLLFEIAVPMAYCGMMSLVILVGPGGGKPDWWLAISIHIMGATLYFVAFWGVGFCFFGVILRRSFVKYLLITLSMLGVLLLPIAIYEGLDDSYLVPLLYYLAGWSVLLLINTLAAFYYMDSRVARSSIRPAAKNDHHNKTAEAGA